MAKKQIKDMGASVRERLLQLAKGTERSFDAVLRQYCQERFLYRLSISPYRKNFVLKGGLLFLSLSMPQRRPTVDVDFAGMLIAAEGEKLKEIFSEIARTQYEDGMLYHTERMSVRKIKEGTNFRGSRIIIPAELAKARTSLQADVVFGDVIAKKPRTIDFPTLLDLPKPAIFAYPLASVIADKFEAIVSRQTATSRMKDFFDIACLARSLRFDGKELREALEKTFAHYGTDLSRCEVVFRVDFVRDTGLSDLWKGFLARNGLQNDEAGFPGVMEKIKRFLEPVVAGTCEDKTWDNEEEAWLPRNPSSRKSG